MCNQLFLILTIVSIAVIVLIIVSVCYIKRKRQSNEVLRFSADDFASVATISLERKARKVLDALYRRAKSEILKAALSSTYVVFISLDAKTCNKFGDQLESLVVNPFIKKMQEEKFTVTYYPNGFIEYDSDSQNPLFSLKFQPARKNGV